MLFLCAGMPKLGLLGEGIHTTGTEQAKHQARPGDGQRHQGQGEGGSRPELAGGWRGGDDAGRQGWRTGQRRMGTRKKDRGWGCRIVMLLLHCLLLACLQVKVKVKEGVAVMVESSFCIMRRP